MKSGKFDTPIDFNPSLDIPDYHIEYINLIEVVQGGPRIGQLSINGEIIPNYRFGGPFLYTTDEFIYIPVLIRSAFILAKVNLKNLIINFIGEPRGILCLEKIENNKIFYYDSLDQIQLKKYDISEFHLTDEKDTPVNFKTEVNIGSTKIRYADILKAGNSHLSIGKLLINGNDLFKYNFGGPFLYNDTLIIIPVYTKSLFFSGFKIAQINLEDCNIQIKGKLNDFIFLQKVENGNIYYYIDLEKKKREMINI